MYLIWSADFGACAPKVKLEFQGAQTASIALEAIEKATREIFGSRHERYKMI